VSFPNVIPALQGWEAMEALPIKYVGVYGIASRAILDSALLEWGANSSQPAPWLDGFKARLGQAAMELVSVQREDGAFGWFYLADASDDRSGFKTSVYLTAYALRALLEVRSSDLMVEDSAIAQAANYLMGARNADGLWSAQGAYFWEVNSPTTDWALSAELFSIIARAQELLGAVPSEELKGIKEKLEKKMAENVQEPAVVAHVLSGLLRWSSWQKDSALRKSLLNRIPYLMSLQRDGYWEPHWYHAYGGMVELNAHILEFLREIDPKGHEAAIREIVMWLLSTREAWGTWHNEIGTANAVRALLKAGAGSAVEVASQVVVKVNGQEVAKVDIDPADPLVSAAGLRQVDLTRFVHAGANKIEINYNGNLTAPVMLEYNQWGIAASGTSTSGVGRLEMVRKVSATTAQPGQPIDVELIVKSDRSMGLVHVTDSIPANMEVESASLRKLVEEGRVLSFQRLADRVVFVIEKVDREVVLKYRIIANREGTAGHAGATANAPFMTNVEAARTVGETLDVHL